ncbi:MAG: formylglycine-generating enzyme family protein [Deltaproteobacteria bacterium]|nr:formylglycine-generating enzyme family protein [Deltaproteobacteria bacterium]
MAVSVLPLMFLMSLASGMTAPFFSVHGTIVLSVAVVQLYSREAPLPEPVEAHCQPIRAEDGPQECFVPEGRVSICHLDKCWDETPAAFWIDRTEVTVREFRKCVDAGVCLPRKFDTFERSEFCNLEAKGREDHPMNCVEWAGALAYCRFVRRRLPTIPEWQRAAGASDGRLYPWGNELPDCERADFHSDKGRGCGTMWTVPADALPAGASPYGLLNMTGNVLEWTSSLSSTCSVEGKTEKELEEDDETMRFVAGGSFADTADALPLTRTSVDEQESKHVGAGFRCARDGD